MGYQFWTRAEAAGLFSIKNIHTRCYDLYAWVTRYNTTIAIMSGSSIDFGKLIYRPPRDGPKLWEIGYPDCSALPDYIIRLYLSHPARVQYEIWERYADLVFVVGVSDFMKDCFFAENSYSPTNWQIKFKVDYFNQNESYMLQILVASTTLFEMLVQFNDSKAEPPHLDWGKPLHVDSIRHSENYRSGGGSDYTCIGDAGIQFRFSLRSKDWKKRARPHQNMR
ncbi:hypothetical protein IEQ34_002707 [Dendrobium chrysotoxum]|uniref:Uncharacterized protein n=1 Tax=Dendrobium chrysotoxum TaxID=161865 RepID=A0AAV7HIK1_DENCH|nr:hypothetical protein IEQ34_002707 [Dendrobium chrysotoxum]